MIKDLSVPGVNTNQLNFKDRRIRRAKTAEMAVETLHPQPAAKPPPQPARPLLTRPNIPGHKSALECPAPDPGHEPAPVSSAPDCRSPGVAS